MRLRRLELVIIAVTLAFACFTGGFFTGRSWSAVNIISVAAHSDDVHRPGVSPQVSGNSTQEQQKSDQNQASPGADTTNATNDRKPSVPSEETGKPKDSDGKININLATTSELTDLPGIGNVLASRIVDHRKLHGDFHKIEDLRNVSGIGEKRFEAIQDKITVGS